MSPLINPAPAGFSDPLALHREALKSCQARFQDGEHSQSLLGLQALFSVVSQELHHRGLALRGQLSRSAAEGLLSEAQIPLAASLLPPARERTLRAATAPYCELLAEAYHLAGGIFSKLDTPRAAASAYAQEIEMRQRLPLKTESQAQAVIEAFFLQCDALVEALDLRAADQHIALARSISRGFSASPDDKLVPSWAIIDAVIADPLVRSFLERADEYREYLSDLRGMVLRVEAAESSFARRALTGPRELVLDAAELRQYACSRRQEGELLPRVLTERLALLHAAAAYIDLRASHSGGAQAVELISSMTPEVRSPEAEQALRVIRNGAESYTDGQTEYDLRPYHVRIPLSESAHYLSEVLLLASFDTAQTLMRTGRFKEAHTVHEWIKGLLSSIDARVSPDAIVIHLNDADAAFNERRLSVASHEAAAAYSLSTRLTPSASRNRAAIAEFQSLSLVRLGLYAQHRFCRVPELVTAIDSLPSNERGQLWATDLLPRLRELQMEEAWGVLSRLFRELTGSDQMLMSSGKKVAGVRVISDRCTLEDRLSRHFLFKASSYYSAALRRSTNSGICAQVGAARALLRDRRREPPELALPPTALLR